MNKTEFLSGLKGRTGRFETVFLVHAKEVRHKKSGDPFLSMTLGDRTGTIDAKMWDNVKAVQETFETGDFIEVRGKMQVYNRHHQVIVHKVTVKPESEVSLADFLPHTDRDVDQLYAHILSTLRGFSNPHLKRLMLGIFRDPEFEKRFKRAPAAKANHHAKLGGLVEHVASVLRLAKAVAANYAYIDFDLLACGTLLHDAGKIFEFRYHRSIDYSDEGRLLGHIPMGSEWLGTRCDEIEGFPPKLKVLLQHLVISHHGEKAFGSPQEPLFPEALALHLIDSLDAKLEMMRAAIADLPPGTAWTPYQKLFGSYLLNKAVYLAEEGPASQPAKPAKRPVTRAKGSGPGQTGPSPRKKARPAVSPSPSRPLAARATKPLESTEGPSADSAGQPIKEKVGPPPAAASGASEGGQAAAKDAERPKPATIAAPQPIRAGGPKQAPPLPTAAAPPAARQHQPSKSPGPRSMPLFGDAEENDDPN